MFKEHFIRLTGYNVWANKKCLQFIEEAGEASLDQEITSSFSSIRKTIYHIYDAEVIWMQRINKTSDIKWPASDKLGSNFNLFEIEFIQASKAFVDFVNGLNDDDLEIILTYKNIAGKEFKNTIRDILTHVMNHGTYHRGQIVTLLRQTGLTQLSSLDYITFCRE